MTVAILVMAMLGLLFGGLLAYAARRFAVRRDRAVERVRSALPGADCAACGFAGCSDLAEAIVGGRAGAGACPVGGAAAAGRVADILGLPPPSLSEPRVAAVICHGDAGGRRTTYDYDGFADCRAALLTPGGAGGFLVCEQGCLGLGTCVRACPFGALRMTPGRLPVVDESRCTACGKCLGACPRNVLELVPRGARAVVRCRSEAPPKQVRAACGAGCVACRLCERACPAGAITVVDNLARVDATRCTGCGLCAAGCPVGAIEVQRPGGDDAGAAGGHAGVDGGAGVRRPPRASGAPGRRRAAAALVAALVAAAVVVLVLAAARASRPAAGPAESGSGAGVPPPLCERTDLAMDTVVRVAIWEMTAAGSDAGGGPAAEAAAVEAAVAALAEFRRLEAVFSLYNPASELAGVNAALALPEAPAGTTPEPARRARLTVSDDLAAALRVALETAATTDGAFDPTVGPLVRAWGLGGDEGPRVPAAAALDNALLQVGYRRLAVDDRTPVLEAVRPLGIDLGAVAKGYAVDAAARALDRRGVRSAVVVAGGCVRAVGRPPGAARWRVAVEHPRRRGEILGVLEAGPGLAVDTAGDYRRFFVDEGVRYHHILDPSTGRPARRSASVTVVAPSAAVADALATGMFVLGPSRALALADRLPGVAAIVVGPDGRVYTSPSLRGAAGAPARGPVEVDALWRPRD